MTRFKSRVAALERGSSDFGSPADLLIRMCAARDRGEAIFAALSPAQQRAYHEWCRSVPDDLVRAMQEAKERKDTLGASTLTAAVMLGTVLVCTGNTSDLTEDPQR